MIDVKAILNRLGHLGWIPPSQRTEEQYDAHKMAMASMRPFPLIDAPLPVGTKIVLTNLWKHPQVVKSLGKPYSGSHQETGSCVNSGAQNAMANVMFTNILTSAVQENIIVPFTLMAYGKSRQMAGMRGRGEGSLGSTMAQALTQYGILDASQSGLPLFTTLKGFDWGSQTELEWSDGAAIPQKWINESQPHHLPNAAPIRTLDDMRSAVAAFCGVTRAHEHWCSPGTEKLVGTGDDQVVIGEYTGTGGHQMSINGYWHHPTEGELFLEINNWWEVYQFDPTTQLKIGYWTRAATQERALADSGSEHFAFSGPLGFIRQSPTYLLV